MAVVVVPLSIGKGEGHLPTTTGRKWATTWHKTETKGGRERGQAVVVWWTGEKIYLFDVLSSQEEQPKSVTDDQTI